MSIRTSGAKVRLGAALSRLGASRPGGMSTDELADLLSLTMQATQTAARLATAPAPHGGKLVEVAAGRPYRLSSAPESAGTSGVIHASKDYFFHTGFGPGQSIRIDLGRPRRVRRIEITNRRSGHQDRAKHLFAVLATPNGPDAVFGMVKHGVLPGGAWHENAITIPEVRARYLTIVSPVATALHFADLRVYATTDAPVPAAKKAQPAPAAKPAPAVPAANPADVIEACAARGIPIKGIVHVGANRAQEHAIYARSTSGPILWVEAIPELAQDIQQRLDPSRPHYVVQAAVAETSGETVRFNISSNNGDSSSLLGLGRHAELYPNITYTDSIELVTRRLDDIVAGRPEAADYNVLVLDVQGAELKVLQGAPELLEQIDAVRAEISPEPLYEGGAMFHEITGLLAQAGLLFRGAAMMPRGWGDALYTRRSG